MVGDGTSIGARCSIKKSIIGRHCNIGNNVKIINSVIMDYVTIKDGYLTYIITHKIKLNKCICVSSPSLKLLSGLFSLVFQHKDSKFDRVSQCKCECECHFGLLLCGCLLSSVSQLYGFPFKRSFYRRDEISSKRNLNYICFRVDNAKREVLAVKQQQQQQQNK